MSRIYLKLVQGVTANLTRLYLHHAKFQFLLVYTVLPANLTRFYPQAPNTPNTPQRNLRLLKSFFCLSWGHFYYSVWEMYTRLVGPLNDAANTQTKKPLRPPTLLYGVAVLSATCTPCFSYNAHELCTHAWILQRRKKKHTQKSLIFFRHLLIKKVLKNWLRITWYYGLEVPVYLGTLSEFNLQQNSAKHKHLLVSQVLPTNDSCLRSNDSLPHPQAKRPLSPRTELQVNPFFELLNGILTGNSIRFAVPIETEGIVFK